MICRIKIRVEEQAEDGKPFVLFFDTETEADEGAIAVAAAKAGFDRFVASVLPLPRSPLDDLPSIIIEIARAISAGLQVKVSSKVDLDAPSTTEASS